MKDYHHDPVRDLLFVQLQLFSSILKLLIFESGSETVHYKALKNSRNIVNSVWDDLMSERKDRREETE